ncbi:MAG: hypothetical protein JRJ20_17895 [Deltaproteobacteria bacterium]|nr:hypothetical protein [Deltaproteobacteria bacterium]
MSEISQLSLPLVTGKAEGRKKLEIFRNLFRKTSSRKKPRRSYREGYKGAGKQAFLIVLIPDGYLTLTLHKSCRQKPFHSRYSA